MIENVSVQQLHDEDVVEDKCNEKNDMQLNALIATPVIFVALFKIILWHLPGGTDGKHENNSARLPLLGAEI
jgi:hypothetical protein